MQVWENRVFHLPPGDVRSDNDQRTKTPHSGVSESENTLETKTGERNLPPSRSPSTSLKANLEADVLCLGLGSPSASQNANIQLAFLLELCSTLNIVRPSFPCVFQILTVTPTPLPLLLALTLGQDHTRISIYDPVFTPEDFELFQELSITVLSDDKASSHTVSMRRSVHEPSRLRSSPSSPLNHLFEYALNSTVNNYR